ncbi:MAG: bifunctional folylpolyglutamate synthase/dihydrofolate synthase [Candidatus Omnitrophica bacterium]|nr:bifunctional folylpolyglutamate synthase/dihydrofolate synthase [Candidatus Omnitrophota bacterium]
MINSYQQAKEYLDSFINYEKISFYPYKASLKQDRMRLLIQCLGIDISKLKAIHIAGTKGKGSTAHFFAWVLAASGFNVGLYTSPHLIDFRERIQIVSSLKSVVNSLISKNDVVKIVKELKPLVDKIELPRELGRFSFFEMYTALAFKYFIDKKVDFVVLETGLGGRLDATNIIMPLLSVITCIDYDHQDKLGKDLASIAAEKCGIIKDKIEVVTSLQKNQALAVIKDYSLRKRADLSIYGRDFRVKNIRINRAYSLFDFESGSHVIKNLKISLKGRYQAENASLAVAGLLLLKQKGALKAQLNFKKGLEECYLEKRFEVVSQDPLVVIDIAHNKASFKALKTNIEQYFPGKKTILIFACSKDKDAKGMLNIIDYSKLILTTFSNPRCQDPKIIKDICADHGALIAKDIYSAFETALGFYSREHIIVVSGSVFLAAEAEKAQRLYKNAASLAC